MKNIILIICLLLIASMAVTVFAAGNGFSLSAPSNTLHPGDTITLTVSVSCNDPATSYGLILSYDESVLELVSGECKVKDALVNSFNRGFAFMFKKPTAYSGDVGTVTFKVKDSAAFGNTVVSGKASVKNGNVVVSATGASISLEITCKHSFGSWVKVDESTHKHICSICKEEETADHSWNDGEMIEQATCTETGIKIYACTACGCYRSEIVPTLDHSHDHYDHDENYHWSVCACGTVIEDTNSAHKYTDDKCECGAIQVKLIFINDDTDIPYTVKGRTVTVSYDMPCRVGYWDGEQYVVITAVENGDGSYSFTAPVGAPEVLIVITGDTNADGRVTAPDIARLNAHLKNKTVLTAETLFAADVNYDGLLDDNDKTAMSDAILGITFLNWEVAMVTG